MQVWQGENSHSKKQNRRNYSKPTGHAEMLPHEHATSLMEWCRAYREDHSQGLVDKRAGGNRAKLSKLQIEALQQMLHQYTPKERLGPRASTGDGQIWSVEDLALIVREKYGVEYQSRTSYSHLLHLCGFSYQKTEKVFKSRSETKVADFEEQLEKN